MLQSRRFKTIVLLLGVIALLAGPSTAAKAQTTHNVNVTAVVTGRTNPPTNNDGHSLAANRVAGPSSFRDDFTIAAVLTCGGNVHAVDLGLPANQEVTFTSDDDVTDGVGTVDPTDSSRALTGTSQSGADVTVRIEGGSFHRLLGVVEVDLSLDVRVGSCHQDGVEVRIVFHLVADVQGLNPSDPLSGFLLVGVASRHGHVDGDRVKVGATVCQTLAPHTPSTVVGSPNPPGRGPLHPCN